MAFQVFDPRGFNTQTDYSGLTQGIGQLIQGQIANHFAKKAEEGDAGSMARLSSIDPRRAATLGSILDTRRQEQMYAEQQAAKQQQQQEEQKRALMGRIARGYTTAKDKVGYLSAAAANMDRAGFSDVADMIMVDLSKYKEAPGEVDQQYQAVQAMFGDGGGENPAQVQYMQYLTQGFEPEDELNARRTAAGLTPKAQAQKTIMIAGVPHNYDPNTGGYTPAKIDNRQITADDVASDAATIKGAEAGASEQARLDAQASRLPDIRAAIKTAEMDAQSRNEKLSELSTANAAMPGLVEVVGQLKELAPIATYTYAGKAFDQASKQLGFGSTPGATARAKYIAIIDNQVLPLLKETFGAAFTIKEGENLKATMGDPDSSPEEKHAQLEAFIANKYREIEKKQRSVSPSANNQAPQQPVTQPKTFTTKTGITVTVE